MANLFAKVVSVVAVLMCLIGASMFSHELSVSLVNLIDPESSKTGERYMLSVFIFTTLIAAFGVFTNKTCFFTISCMLFAADVIEGISFAEVDRVRWLVVHGDDEVVPPIPVTFYDATGLGKDQMEKVAGGGVMMLLSICLSILCQAMVNRDKNQPIHILARVFAFVGIAITMVGCIIIWSLDQVKFEPAVTGNGSVLHDVLLYYTSIGVVVSFLGVVGFSSNQFETVLGATATAAYLGVPLLGSVLANNDKITDETGNPELFAEGNSDSKKILAGGALVWLGCLTQCIAGGFVLSNPNRDYSLA